MFTNAFCTEDWKAPFPTLYLLVITCPSPWLSLRVRKKFPTATTHVFAVFFSFQFSDICCVSKQNVLSLWEHRTFSGSSSGYWFNFGSRKKFLWLNWQGLKIFFLVVIYSMALSVFGLFVIINWKPYKIKCSVSTRSCCAVHCSCRLSTTNLNSVLYRGEVCAQWVEKKICWPF